ncbi:bifunctional methyltransferase/pyrophosphohydrolase YabN [Metabacillus arenae]|uniref:Nucleoside triphosphate pyrophosphohydrolase n=1 Tax=Metabacillus arenae TaxID=2771434 RepID=A0A926S0D5_9BACI|nr:nucleoside triphosphate pyrophosphohydrolase [Metabacillus arenae]MBD1383177.1 nucleoside triphosphate pyrophosphohydrolase [Metabacillus arenae]
MHTITVVGLGAGDLSQMQLGIYKLLTNSPYVFVRTTDHPVLKELSNELSIYRSFDDVYMKHDQFEKVYEEIVDILLEESKENPIIYAVPGHPLVAEKTVQLLLGKVENLEIVGGQSFLDAMFNALKIDPIEGFQFVDALSIKKEELQLKQHLLVGQVYDQMIASEAKLTLMEQYPDDHLVYIVTAAGSKEQDIKKVPLFELDRVTTINNLTSVYVPPITDEKKVYHQFHTFRQVIADLRGPNGCPWDKEQTHESLKKYLIEECYELIEAIDEEDIDHVIEELGDVLLQVVLHAQIGEDNGLFTIEDVIREITAKMIRRHPHVFAQVDVSNSDEVLANWEQIKKEEGKGEERKSLLDGVAGSLPGLSKAYHLQKKAAKVGFDWPEVEEAWEKVKEEMQEFRVELANNSSLTANKKVREEYGDLLFALVNIGRFYSIEPEEALTATNNKFTRRFQYIEKKAEQAGKELTEMSLKEMDRYWNEAKKEERMKGSNDEIR